MTGTAGSGAAVVRLDAAGLARDAGLAGALLRLNNDHATELSLLDGAGLAGLVRQAFWAGRVGDSVAGDAAMLIALDQGAAYGSVNFQWFRARYRRFVYVDRVVVGAGLRGRGVATALYAGVFAAAAAAGHRMVGCEVNVAPVNAPSLRLHERLGFVRVGDGWPGADGRPNERADGGAGKRVAYLVRETVTARCGAIP